MKPGWKVLWLIALLTAIISVALAEGAWLMYLRGYKAGYEHCTEWYEDVDMDMTPPEETDA